MKYQFITREKANYPVKILCKVMGVCRSAYYEWARASAKIFDKTHFSLCQSMKNLFIASRQSLGSRQMMKKLRKEGYIIGRYKVRSLMKQLGLFVKTKKKFVITTDSKHKEPVAENLLNRKFLPTSKNCVWTTDISYLWTNQGWIYLAVVIDLYSRRVVGWHIDDDLSVALVTRALVMAIALRCPPSGLMHHSDRGSQYASKAYQRLLEQHRMICSMSRKGNCWDNAPTERFFSSLKREWTTGIVYHDKTAAIKDARKYIQYYNSVRLHTTINDMTPIEFEKCA